MRCHRRGSVDSVRDRLTVVRLPAYAPALDPTEAVWAWMKRGITTIAVRGADHVAHLRACQQHTDLIAGLVRLTAMLP